MDKFNFFLDQKITTWMRTDFLIEAETLEEAVELAKKKYETGDLYELSWEEVEGVKKIMEVGDNGGEPTEELYDESGRFILNNVK
jgi:hypothetical protein